MHHQTVKEKLFSASLLAVSSLLLAATCEIYSPPEIETCVHNENDYGCILEESEYDRSFNDSIGYLCTNPDDYHRIVSYCEDIRVKLINCESKVCN